MPTNDNSGNESDGVECPWDGCERSFSSENGMKVHHVQIHGESVAGVEVECAECGDTISVKAVQARDHEKHFCDYECMGAWNSENRTGENNHQWVEKVEVTCSWCGETKLINPSLVNDSGRHFCNPDSGIQSRCQRQWFSENIRGEVHPMWNGGLVEVDCEYCGDTKSIPRAHAKKADRHFCNSDNGNGHSECRKQWWSENISGENHHQWTGGEVPYGRGWSEKKKERVRERDGRKCQHCGRDEERHIELVGKKHSVHHIQKARHFDNPEHRNHLDNLITLCGIPAETGRKSCHQIWEDMSPLRPDM